MTKYYGGRVVDKGGNPFTDTDNEFGLLEVWFHPNGVSGDDICVYVYPGTKIYLPHISLCGWTTDASEDMIFIGWSKDAPKSKAYYVAQPTGVATLYNPATHMPSESYAVTASTHFYAHWFSQSDSKYGNDSLGYRSQSGRYFGRVRKTSEDGSNSLSAGTFSNSRYDDYESYFINPVFKNEIRVHPIPRSIDNQIGSPTYGQELYPPNLKSNVILSNTTTPRATPNNCELGTIIGGNTSIRLYVLTSFKFTTETVSNAIALNILVSDFPEFKLFREYNYETFVSIYDSFNTKATSLEEYIFQDNEGATVYKNVAPYHTAVLLPSPSAYSKAGSTLAAWSTTYNNAPLYRPTGTFVNVGDYDVWTAYYQAAKFILVYDLNGGYSDSSKTGSTELAYSATSGKQIIVNDVSNYTREGYVLVGWERAIGGISQDSDILVPSLYPYYLYDAHPKTDGDYTFITLKAKWEKTGVARALTVKDDTELPDTDANFVMQVYDGYSYFIPRSDSPSFKVNGYDFRGWKYNGEVFSSASAEANGFAYALSIPANDVTVTALYSLIEYTFTLTVVNQKMDSTQAGDTTIQTSTVKSTSKTFELNSLLDNGVYSFIGWGIGESATAVQIPSTATSFTLSLDTVGATVSGRNVSITLRALWMDARPAYRVLFQYPHCTDLTSAPPAVLESESIVSGTTYEFTIPTTVPKRQAPWIFLGWMTSTSAYTGAGLIDPGSKVTVTRENDGQETKGQLILYAHWYRYKYDLSYDLQGGSSEAFPSYVEYSVLYGNRSVMIPRDVPIHPTQSFVGWVDEDGKSISSGNSLLLSPAKMAVNLTNGSEMFYVSKDSWDIAPSNPEKKTLYAQYTGQTAILSFDLRGGTGSFGDMTYDKVGNEASYQFTIPSTVPTKASYVFYAWGTSPTDRSTATYSPGSKIEVMINQRTILYAHWNYSPASSGGSTVTYDVQTGEPLTIAGELMKVHGEVTSVGVPFEFSIEPPVGAGDEFFVSKSSSYRVSLYLRNGDVVDRVKSAVWYYSKKNYTEGGAELYFCITRASVANDKQGGAYVNDYVIRIVTVDAEGNEYNAYQSFTIAPAGKIEDVTLAPPECTLSTYMAEGADESRMVIEGITNFARKFDATLVEFPILTRRVRDRYIIDTGTLESYSLSFTRVNPMSVNNSSTDSREWSNAQWIVRFRQFLDFWQNLSYAQVNGEFKRTGGFKFTYVPSDISLFPIIEKNVFVKGNVDFDYMVGKVKGNLTLVVANMQMEELYKPELYEIYFCTDEDSAKIGAYTFSIAAYQGIPFVVPSFPQGYNEDCIYWTDVSGKKYYPGNTVEGILSNKYLYAVVATRVGVESWVNAGTYTKTVPNDAYFAKAIIVGGGGSGDYGKCQYVAAISLGESGWEDDNLCDFNSGGGGGAGEAYYPSFNVTPGAVMNVHVGAGGAFEKGSANGAHPGEESSIQIGAMKLVAKGGDAANKSMGGQSSYAGGAGYSKGGWFDLGATYMDDVSENPGQTNSESPRGKPGYGHKLGSGGGASALENGVNGSDVTSIGGYWTGNHFTKNTLHAPQYGGGGAGGGYISSIPKSYAGRPGDGASGYVKVIFYK